MISDRLDDIANLCQLCFSGVGLLVGNRCALAGMMMMILIVINGSLMQQHFICAVFGQTTSTSNGITSPKMVGSM